jgi:hypothetical protein
MAVFPRRTGAASAATLSAITLSVGLAHLVAPDWSREVGLDIWNWPAAEAGYRLHTGRGEELDDLRRRVRVQIEVTNHLAAELAAGRLSVGEAADELARVNRGRPGFDAAMGYAYPGLPDLRHRLARYGIDKGLYRLAGADPAERRAAEARLEAEYRALAGSE